MPTKMPAHLFTSFLNSPEEYGQAEKLWERICERAFAQKHQQTEWVQWLNTSYADGSRFMDGNPIFSRYSAKQHKGISITQERIEICDQVYIYARTRLFGEGTYEKPIQHLVIGCELSEESAAIAEQLIEHWADEQTNMHTMAFFIDRILSTLPGT